MNKVGPQWVRIIKIGAKSFDIVPLRPFDFSKFCAREMERIDTVNYIKLDSALLVCDDFLEAFVK